MAKYIPEEVKREQANAELQKQKEAGVLKAGIKYLASLLEAERPANFNPQWLKENDSSLLSYFYQVARDSNGDVDWQIVVGQLPVKWQKRWVYGKIGKSTPNSRKREAPIEDKSSERQEAAKDKAIKELIALLENEKPEMFNVVWLQKADSGLWSRLWHMAKDPKHKTGVDWSKIISQLPEEWQKRWKHVEQRKARTWSFDEAVNALTELLNEKKPKTFNPSWIGEEYPGLYQYIQQNIKTAEGKIDWERIIKALSPEQQKQWDPVLGNFPKQVERLAKLLETEKPESFDAAWIGKRSRGIARYAERHLKADNGDWIDWSKIVSKLDPKLQKLWAGKKGLKQTRAEIAEAKQNNYQNPDEVNNVLDKYQEKLYTFLSAETESEKTEREAICKELFVLVKKGNSLAREELKKFVRHTIDNWVDERPEFQVYAHHPDRLEEKLETCIDFYQGQGPFLGYVFSSLKLEAIGLKYPISLDEEFPRSNIKRADNLMLDPQTGEYTILPNNLRKGQNSRREDKM